MLLFVKGILQKTNDTESEFEDTGKQHIEFFFLFKAFILAKYRMKKHLEYFFINRHF